LINQLISSLQGIRLTLYKLLDLSSLKSSSPRLVSPWSKQNPRELLALKRGAIKTVVTSAKRRSGIRTRVAPRNSVKST